MRPGIKLVLTGNDRKKGYKYVTIGRKAVLEMHRERVEKNLSVLRRRWRPEPGVVVSLEASAFGNLVDIRADSLKCDMWMDSGLVALGSAAVSPSGPHAYDPGILYLDSSFTGLPRGSLYVQNGAAVAPTVSTPPTAGNGQPTPAFTIPVDAHGNTPPDNALGAKKSFAADAPASLYSGAMRVFVQALYGKKFTDQDVATYVVQKPEDAVPYITLLGEEGEPLFSIVNSGGTSSGVHLDATYMPWFVVISGNHVTVRATKLSACGEEVRKVLLSKYPLVAGSKFVADRNVLVAYMLSETWIDKDGFNHTFTTDIALSGAPLAYGWAFNKNGDTAEIITHASVTVAGASGWAASRYKVTISRDVVTDMSSYPAAEREWRRWHILGTKVSGPSNWNFHFGSDYVWVPRWQHGQLQLTTYYPPGTPQIGPYGSAPLYLWYAPDTDLPVVVTARLSGGASTPVSGWAPFHGQPLDTAKCWCGAGVSTPIAYPGLADGGSYSSGSSGVSEFEVVVGASSNVYQGSNTAIQIDWSIVGDTGSTPSHPADFTPGPGLLDDGGLLKAPACAEVAGSNAASDATFSEFDAAASAAGFHTLSFEASRAFVYGANGKYEEDVQEGLSTLNHVALVIPTYDCSAVYLFESRQVGATRHNHTVLNISYAGYHWWELLLVTHSPSGFHTDVYAWILYQTRNSTSSNNWVSGGGTSIPNDYVTTVKGKFYGSNGSPITLPDDVVSANVSNLLAPSISYPYHDTPFFTRAAANFGGYAGEGVLGGGYSVPATDTPRFELTFLGYA